MIFLKILNMIVGGLRNTRKGVAGGFKRMFKGSVAKTLASISLKFSLGVMGVSGGVFIVLFAWATVSTSHLIMEGEFDPKDMASVGGDTPSGGGGSGSGDQIYSDYNEITRLINKVDLEKMPWDEDWPADIDPKMYVRPEIKPKILLEFYLLLAEICADEGIYNAGESGLHVTPLYLLGNWYHECAWSLSGDHIKSAWTAWSLYWFDGSATSNGFRASGLYGASGYSHGMTNLSPNGGRGAMTGPSEIWQANSVSSASYGYISRAENPDLKGDRVIKGTMATVGSTLGDKVKQKEHSVYPIAGKIERPSSQFLADASYTAAKDYAEWICAGSPAIGSIGHSYALEEANAAKKIAGTEDLKVDDGAAGLMLAPIMATRAAGKPYNADLPGVNSDFGGLHGKFHTGLFVSGWVSKLCGVYLMEKYDNANNALFPGIYKTITGGSNWGDKSWTKTEVMMSVESLGKRTLNGESVDFSNMYTELKNRVDQVSGGDNVAAAIFPAEIYIMGTHVQRTIVELATQMSKKYPNEGEGSGGSGGEPDKVGESVSIGDGTYDKNGDRICDYCSKSIYESNSDCKGPDVSRPSPHPVQKKLIFPIAGDCYFSAPGDFHGANSGCPTHGAVTHLAYDMTTGNLHPGIVSVANGEVVKCENSTTNFGCHTVIAYPNSTNPEYKIIYAHMSRYTHVDLSGSVRAGTILGYMGSTGWSTGHHLHMEIYKGSKAVDYRDVNSGIVYMSSTGASECYTAVSSMNDGECKDLGCKWGK